MFFMAGFFIYLKKFKKYDITTQDNSLLVKYWGLELKIVIFMRVIKKYTQLDD